MPEGGEAAAQMMNVYVIGCGGIGGYVIDKLLMVISSLSLDLMSPVDSEEALRTIGNKAVDCFVDRVTLIDGDVFNPRNAVRQGAGAGSKLARRMLSLSKRVRLLSNASDTVKDAVATLLDEKVIDNEDLARMNREMIKVSFLQKLQLVGYNEYLNPSNVGEIIPIEPEANPENLGARATYAHLGGKLDATVVFVCVDNKKTRFEISEYMQRFDDCLLINGGNDKVTGHVTVYERSGGKALDPMLFEVYPDVTPDADRRPDEVGCEVVAPKHDQIAVTNSMLADIMLSRFVQWAENGLFIERRTKDAVKYIRYNDIEVNVMKPSITSLYHPLTN